MREISISLYPLPPPPLPQCTHLHWMFYLRFSAKSIAVSGQPEHCSIFLFPPHPPPSSRYSRDIPTFLISFMVYSMKTKYFLSAYHPGWSFWPPGLRGSPEPNGRLDHLDHPTTLTTWINWNTFTTWITWITLTTWRAKYSQAEYSPVQPSPALCSRLTITV